MRREGVELESIALTAFAAVPLYVTGAINPVALLVFHGVLLLIVLQILWKKRRPQIPPALARAVAIGYFVFFLFDGLFLSRRLIRSSTHLVLLIAIYLILEEEWRKNYGKRLLIAFLIFVAAAATSTHLTVVLFVVAFVFLALRQLMRASQSESLPGGAPAGEEVPVSRSAAWYVGAAFLFATGVFPLLPRIANPALQGLSRGLPGSATGLSDTIDFSHAREISPTGDVVARVWMPQEAVPFFTPLRLKGATYDAWVRGIWRPRRGFPTRMIPSRNGVFQIARRHGVSSSARVQQQLFESAKLFLPAGTWEISGPPYILEGPGRDVYRVGGAARGMASYNVGMSRDVTPLRAESPSPIDYPVTPRVTAMARSIVGSSTSPMAAAAKIESYLSTRFTYIPDPALLGRPISVEDFLLRVRRGHCEYFAAGMVVLLTSLDIPARVVGGFYGGELNPLTGYFVVRKRDAHAWVEVWDGKKWTTFDPTPASLRPGNAAAGLLRVYLSAIGDSMTFFWDRYILTFGMADQVAMITGAMEALHQAMQSFRSGVSLASLRSLRPTVLLFPLGLAVLLVLIRRVMASRQRTLFLRLAAQLGRLGIPVTPSMTSAEIVDATRRARPDLALPVGTVLGFYVLDRFSGRTPPEDARAEARRAMTVLREAK